MYIKKSVFCSCFKHVIILITLYKNGNYKMNSYINNSKNIQTKNVTRD